MASHKKIQEDPKLLETVQMFEVITSANPDDYQSYEILKEAYSKLGREKDAVEASKKIAKIYVRLGQISHAILEYEGVLQISPDDAEVLACLGELESKMPGYAAGAQPAVEAPSVAALAEAASGEDANILLIDFMIQQGLFVEKNKPTIISMLSAKVAETAPHMPPPCVIDIVSERMLSTVDNTLLFLTQATKIPFMPLENYEVDPRRAEMIDQNLSVSRLILPFDQISKTVFAVTVNPFDREAIQKVENAAQCRVQWFLTRPDELRLKIKEVFRLLT